MLASVRPARIKPACSPYGSMPPLRSVRAEIIWPSKTSQFGLCSREEAMKGWAEKLAQGWLPAVPPPGYMTVTEGGKRIHVPNPETKALIQRVFKKYLEPSQTIKTITKEMELMGIRTRKGRPYNRRYVDKMLRDDALEEMTIELLDKLVCPSREIIQWVADAIRKEQKDTIEDREKLVASIPAQLERVNHMDDSLYDDKLAGEITQSKYEEKHTLFVEERKNLQEKLEKLDQSAGLRLEHALVSYDYVQYRVETYHQRPRGVILN